MIVKNILLRVCGIVGKEWRKESFSLNFFCKQTLESWKLFLQNLTKLINLMVYIVRLLNGTFEGTKYFCIWNDRIYRRCFLEPKQQIGVSPFSSLFFDFIFNCMFEIEMLLNCSPVLNMQNFQTFASLFFKVGLLFLFYSIKIYRIQIRKC